MPCDILHLTTLVELWSRRRAPVSADLQRALHIARNCCSDATAPLWIRSIAWQLVHDGHEAAGWEIPKTENLSPCLAAAASIRHGCSILTTEVAGQVRAMDGPVVVLGAFGAGRSVFGKWDLLPTAGAVLVPLTYDTSDLPSATNFNVRNGIFWASAGRHKELLAENCTEAQLSDCRVLVPSPALVVARTSATDLELGSVGSLIFCGAAFNAASNGHWQTAKTLARRLESKTTPLELAMRLGIDQWLGLKVSTRKRMAFVIRRAFRRPAA